MALSVAELSARACPPPVRRMDVVSAPEAVDCATPEPAKPATDANVADPDATDRACPASSMRVVSAPELDACVADVALKVAAMLIAPLETASAVAAPFNRIPVDSWADDTAAAAPDPEMSTPAFRSPVD